MIIVTKIFSSVYLAMIIAFIINDLFPPTWWLAFQLLFLPIALWWFYVDWIR